MIYITLNLHKTYLLKIAYAYSVTSSAEVEKVQFMYDDILEARKIAKARFTIWFKGEW